MQLDLRKNCKRDSHDATSGSFIDFTAMAQRGFRVGHMLDLNSPFNRILWQI